MNPTNTVFDLKRLIGYNFDDEAMQSGMKYWPFKIMDSKGKAKQQFGAKQTSTMVLSKAKQTAKVYLGEEVTDAVITVPAYFNDNQRNATIDAAKMAGLNVLRLINEPTAATIAYGMDRKSEKQHNVLIFNWGGGAFNVSILSIKNDEFEVKAVGGNTHLGGRDISSRLVDHNVEMIKQAHAGKDLTTTKKAVHRLRKACETAKKMLT
ncbi:heat shock protein 70 [Echinococcus multilocularis]|uniref:Heat shock protein 70 n=1 Tax=Echinococcus multilocularis TaxID=6211 RepID=A0A0S4MP69_ECHMU|nr:heat shock protein 70 [Echinococcus multilocularis]